MVQTLEQILEDIESAQAEFPELSELNSPSATSFWRLIKNMFALLALNLQKSMDTYRTEVDAIANTNRVGTLSWYVQQMKAFQFGDTLIYDEKGIRYLNDSPEKRIIHQAAATDTNDGNGEKVVLKVATKNVNGRMSPLNDQQSNAFFEYLEQIKFPGIRYEFRNVFPEKVKLVGSVQVNRLLLTTDTGGRVDNVAEFPIRDAIISFLENLPFDGRLYLSELIAHLAQMDEVEDVYIGFYYEDANGFVSFRNERFKDSYAGYFEFDENSLIVYV